MYITTFQSLCMIIAGKNTSMVRLVGGSRRGEGRLELNLGVGWGSVCFNQKWNTTTASYFCVHLCGYNEYCVELIL